MSYVRMAGQFVVIAALFAAVAAFSNSPVYRQIPVGSSVVMLTFVHGADRKAECRKLSPEEIRKLPPNMRRVQECPRGRRPLYVELDLGGQRVFQASLRDTPRTEGFDYERKDTVTLVPDQMFVIDFRPDGGGFVFR